MILLSAPLSASVIAPRSEHPLPPPPPFNPLHTPTIPSKTSSIYPVSVFDYCFIPRVSNGKYTQPRTLLRIGFRYLLSSEGSTEAEGGCRLIATLGQKLSSFRG
ncbi:hypothetical protein J6590_103189, partial [Homalodisca vitripennis]